MATRSWPRSSLACILALILTLGGLLHPGTGGGAALATAVGCTVTTTADDTAPVPPGSLREKLADTTCAAITFAPGVTGTIALAADLPTVARTVVVTGPGAASLTVDRNAPICCPATIAFPVEAGGDLTLVGLTVANATSGVALAASTSAVTLTNSRLQDNLTGVNALSNGTATVTGSTIAGGSNGLFMEQGGTATLTNSTIIGSDTSLYLTGSGTATVSGSTFSFTNDGLYLGPDVTATVMGSTFTGGGDGIFAYGRLTVAGSTFSGQDIAIFMPTGAGTLTNSTVAGATSAGLVIANSAALAVTNSTLAGNAIGLYSTFGGTATLANTLLAKGSDANCSVNQGGTVVNAGHNLADDATCFADNSGPGGGSHVRTTVQLGLATTTPQDNGGPTKTVALTAASAAVDAGDDATCALTGPGNVNGVDQRGTARPQDAHCDVGAYERPSSATALTNVRGDGRYRGSVTYTATLTQGGQPVVGQVVAFTLRGAAQCSVAGGPNACPKTDANGVARLTIAMNLVAPGTYANLVGVKVAGTANTLASSGTGPLVIAP